MRTRIKFCGMTRQEDVQYAIKLGVDALGFIFYPQSQRYLTLDAARTLALTVPPFVTLVGVFVNPSAQTVNQVLDRVPLNVLQFHGEESESFCNGFNRPYIKAIRMQPGVDVLAQANHYASAQGLLLDSYHPQQRGGSGISFAWDMIPASLPLPIILSGGLHVHNVVQAITTIKPYAVDVSSGIESAQGIKDMHKMQELVNVVLSTQELDHDA